eukprot:12403510-Karenia_brevis.AAC.1
MTYADDLQGLSDSRASVTKMAYVTDEFANLTGQSISNDKSKAFTTAAGGRHAVKVHSGNIQWVHQAEILGATIAFQGTSDCERAVARIEDGCVYADKVRWLQLGFYGRSNILQTGMLPRALHASSVTHVPKQQLNKLQTRVSRAVWGEGRRYRCKKILYTLLCPGHCTDPHQVVEYACLITLHRMLIKHRNLHGLFEETWAHHSAGRLKGEGPICKLFKTLRALQWEWPEPYVFVSVK